MQAVKKNLFIACPSKSTYFTSLAATMTKAKKKGLKGTSSPLKFNSPTRQKKNKLNFTTRVCNFVAWDEDTFWGPGAWSKANSDIVNNNQGTSCNSKR